MLSRVEWPADGDGNEQVVDVSRRWVESWADRIPYGSEQAMGVSEQCVCAGDGCNHGRIGLHKQATGVSK